GAPLTACAGVLVHQETREHADGSGRGARDAEGGGGGPQRIAQQGLAWVDRCAIARLDGHQLNALNNKRKKQAELRFPRRAPSAKAREPLRLPQLAQPIMNMRLSVAL